MYSTYLVSSPLIDYYYTEIVGDAKVLPTLKAAASFVGMAVIDADPYIDGGGGTHFPTHLCLVLVFLRWFFRRTVVCEPGKFNQCASEHYDV